MDLRCPYCHAGELLPARSAACRRCGALQHAACALELARCAACGGRDLLPGGAGAWAVEERWQLVPAGAPDVTAFLRLAPRELPGGDDPGRLRLGLEVPERELATSGLLACELRLAVPAPVALGPLVLALESEWIDRGLLGRLRRARRPVRQLRLLGPAPSGGGWWRRLRGQDRGLYAPGRYAVAVRLPLDGVHPTREDPGAPWLHRVHLRASIDAPGGPLTAEVELRLGALDAREPLAPAGASRALAAPSPGLAAAQ